MSANPSSGDRELRNERWFLLSRLWNKEDSSASQRASIGDDYGVKLWEAATPQYEYLRDKDQKEDDKMNYESVAFVDDPYSNLCITSITYIPEDDDLPYEAHMRDLYEYYTRLSLEGTEEYEEVIKKEAHVAEIEHTTPYAGNDTLNNNQLNSSLTTPCTSGPKSTPPIERSVEALIPDKEIVHFPGEISELNSRVIALELENSNRLKKEKVFVGLGVAYFLLKAIVFYIRNN